MNHEQTCEGCGEYADLSRRSFLKRSTLATAASYSAPAWLPKVALGRGTVGSRDVLVHTFLRGAIDGLSVIVPYMDGDLYNARPQLAINPPGQTDGAIDLDGFFGLNPNAASLSTMYGNGHLAIMHAAGSTDPSRSHFDAMRAMEGGLPNTNLSAITTGWIGRYLDGVRPTGSGLLRGVALSDLMPLSFEGGDGTLPVPDPANFEFPGRVATRTERRAAVQSMYTNFGQEPLAGAMLSTFETIDLLNTIDFANYSTAGAVPYPGSLYGQQLRAAAAMIKADIDIEVLSLDYGGWDHHNAMGPLDGILANRLSDLTLSLDAFYQDLLATNHLDRVVSVLMSEFGRRVAENVSLGTDHGHGNMMLVFGGNIAGGQVVVGGGGWPGLADANLDNGDLQVVTDYRDVVSEILLNRMGASDVTDVFPGHTPTSLGITV